MLANFGVNKRCKEENKSIDQKSSKFLKTIKWLHIVDFISALDLEFFYLPVFQFSIAIVNCCLLNQSYHQSEDGTVIVLERYLLHQFNFSVIQILFSLSAVSSIPPLGMVNPGRIQKE